MIAAGLDQVPLTFEIALALLEQPTKRLRAITARVLWLHAEVLNALDDRLAVKKPRDHSEITRAACVVPNAERETHHSVVGRTACQFLDEFLPLVEPDDSHVMDPPLIGTMRRLEERIGERE